MLHSKGIARGVNKNRETGTRTGKPGNRGPGLKKAKNRVPQFQHPVFGTRVTGN
jgi:hypothetical protein